MIQAYITTALFELEIRANSVLRLLFVMQGENLSSNYRIIAAQRMDVQIITECFGHNTSGSVIVASYEECTLAWIMRGMIKTHQDLTAHQPMCQKSRLPSGFTG